MLCRLNIVLVMLIMITLSECAQAKTQRPILFSTYVNDAYAIVTVNPSKGDLLTWKENDQNALRAPILSPDGRQVLYFECRVEVQCDLRVAKLNGQADRRLAGPFLAPFWRDIQWSPSGRHIALRALTADTQEKVVYVLSVETGDIVRSFVEGQSFTWTSSSQIAMIWQREPLKSGLYIIDVEQGEEKFILLNDPERLLTDIVGQVDKEHLLIIAHSSARQFVDRAFVLRVSDGSLEEIPIRNDDGAKREIHYLQIAPSGKRLSFELDHLSREGNQQESLALLDLETSEEYVFNIKVESYLLWSPDGRHILFTCGGKAANRPKSSLCLASPDDGTVKRTFTGESIIWDLSW